MKKILCIIALLLINAIPAFCDDVLPKEDLREQARFLYSTNDIVQSRSLLMRIPDNEKTADDYLLLANIAQDNKNNVDAVFYLQKAIITDPSFYKAYYNLANLYYADNKIYSAMENYKKVTKLKKDFAYAYYNLGCCHLKKQEYMKAKFMFGYAIKYKPDEPSFYYNLAYTYKMMKKEKKAEEALTMYNNLMKD